MISIRSSIPSFSSRRLRVRHRLLTRLLLLSAILGGARSLASAAALEEADIERPNILWITCEDMSPNLGCYGDAYAATPHLDRLAARSVRYTRAFATAPVCSPVRSCLITGVYATTLGTQNLRSTFPVPEFMKGFPSYLRAAGYRTTNNVKTDYNTSREPAIVEASWDESSESAHWRGRREGQPFFAVFNDMTTHQSRSMVWPYEEFEKRVQSRLPAGARHDPAAASVPPYYPDTPVVRRTIARYYDCISVMDLNTAGILEQLEADGLAESTI
ncbi:MAG: sulfatase-like hydrolase/transferase, partial [Planctomycetes bacterium]|nr:sulfatase-like hydrolase/transferase [Planctomycetota bacterium]